MAHLPSQHDLDNFDFNYSVGVSKQEMKELRELSKFIRTLSKEEHHCVMEATGNEHDIMYGRGAYLYKQVERELAFQREQAKILRQFEAMRASIYQ